MKTIFAALITISLPLGSAMADLKLGFGSRAGMEVTVLSERGLDTEEAVIMTKHTRENATSYCVEYVGRVTERCVNEQLSLNLNDRVVGNCETGEFVDFYGNIYRFEGKMPQSNNVWDPKYAIRDLATNEIEDGTSASGYPINIRIYRALCPRIAPSDE